MTAQGSKIPFLGVTSGRVFVSYEREPDRRWLRELLESFGEIYSFEAIERDGREIIVCEYYDRRRVIDVIESANGRDMFVCHLTSGLT